MTFTHDDLIDIGRKWLINPYAQMREYGHCGCGVVITEISANTYGGEIPDILGFSEKKSILIECKTSRSDFIADGNKVFRNPNLSDMALGSQRWYLAPEGIIPKEKVPEKWGLLEVTLEGIIKETIYAKHQESNKNSEVMILLSVMRRLKISEKDDHVAIKRFKPLRNSRGEIIISKKRAEFYIEEGDSVQEYLESIA